MSLPSGAVGWYMYKMFMVGNCVTSWSYSLVFVCFVIVIPWVVRLYAEIIHEL